MKYSGTLSIVFAGLAGISQAQSTYYACSMKNAVTVDQYVASITPKGSTSGGLSGGRSNLDLQNQLNQSSAAGACLIASSVGAGTCERVPVKRQTLAFPVIPCPAHMACLKQSSSNTMFQCYDVNSGDYVSPTGACYVASTKKYDENCLADSKEEFDKLGIKFPENAAKASTSNSSSSSASSSSNKSSSTSSSGSALANGAAQVGNGLAVALVPFVVALANI